MGRSGFSLRAQVHGVTNLRNEGTSWPQVPKPSQPSWGQEGSWEGAQQQGTVGIPAPPNGPPAVGRQLSSYPSRFLYPQQ